MAQRRAHVVRHTKETRIDLRLNLDGQGRASVKTGMPFLDHMLDLFARHSVCDLDLRAKGDLEVDYHHLVEDLGIALGEAIRKALGNKKGICRYGFAILPMDECLAQAAIDFSGRSFLVYRVKSVKKRIRDFDVSMVREFMQGLANAAQCNLHLELRYGDEPHHILEAIFKALARAFDMAKTRDPRVRGVPSTKGKL
ncbi:MAG: imidazoleglycerol-phosphate dehydratase HisB [Verrucomicrobiae bacterium]|nr:imidazoleglycerol-phosphate dehydratase HisB [Verrucomicrobiae bacterium]